MTDIDIGPGATDRADVGTYGTTAIFLDNLSNDTGVLTSFEVWANTQLGSFKIGTFYGSSTSWTSRDYESIGTVAAGSKQTFSGLNCDVTANDALGAYFSSGNIEADAGGGGRLYKSGDQFTGSAVTFTSSTGIFSIYGIGATAVVGWTGKIQGVTNPSKIWGVSVTNISKVGGI